MLKREANQEFPRNSPGIPQEFPRNTTIWPLMIETCRNPGSPLVAILVCVNILFNPEWLPAMETGDFPNVSLFLWPGGGTCWRCCRGPILDGKCWWRRTPSWQSREALFLAWSNQTMEILRPFQVGNSMGWFSGLKATWLGWMFPNLADLG